MPKYHTYVGIDPGKSGGIVAIGPRVIEWTVMPETEHDLWEWIEMLTPDADEVVAVIERVNAMPKQGVSSVFTFGRGYGGLRMALIAASIPFEDVTPQTWMKALHIPAKKKGMTPGAWKGQLRGKAQQLFPSLSLWKEKKGTQLAVADALLIAEYCRRKKEGKL